MDIFMVIAWVSTALAVLLVSADLVGLDGIFGGFFEIRAVTGFGCGFGWTGSIMQDAGYSTPLTLVAASLSGVLIGGLMLLFVATFAKLSRPKDRGLDSLLKLKAEVTIVDPSSNELRIRTMFRGHLHEFAALAEGFSPNAGQIVVVEKISPSGKLVVAPEKD